MITWNTGSGHMTALLDFLNEPPALTDALINAFEAAAGVTGDFESSDEHAGSWYGLVGTFKGETFTVYTHKSGRLKIGGDPDSALDIIGLKAALLAVPLVSRAA